MKNATYLMLCQKMTIKSGAASQLVRHLRKEFYYPPDGDQHLISKFIYYLRSCFDNCKLLEFSNFDRFFQSIPITDKPLKTRSLHYRYQNFG